MQEDRLDCVEVSNKPVEDSDKLVDWSLITLMQNESSRANVLPNVPSTANNQKIRQLIR